MSEIQFDVVRLISDEGGQCDVHELVRRRDKKRFAAKFPKTLHAHLPEVQERFNREVDHYRRVHAYQPHPHVAQMFDLIDWKGRKGILLELMETSFARRQAARHELIQPDFMRCSAELAAVVSLRWTWLA